MPPNRTIPQGWMLQSPGGRPRLWLPIPREVRPLQLKSLTPGSRKLYWVTENTVEELPLKGWIEEGGAIYLSLPLPGGGGAAPLPVRPGKPVMMRLLSALAKLEAEVPEKARPILESPLRTGGILLPEMGGVAFLDPDFTLRIFSLGGGDGVDEALVHPALQSGRSPLFSIAVLAYRGLAGAEPFCGEEEELRERILRGVFLPLAAHIPTIDHGLERWVHRGLLGESSAAGYFAEGVRLFGSHDPEKADSLLSPEEGELRRLSAQKEGRRREKGYARRRFLRRRGALLLGFFAVAAALGSLGGSILTRILGPPITQGWKPREVVEAFYRGINDLDPHVMEEVTADKAGKVRINQVLSLYSISRIRLGYEGVTPHVNAADWAARKKHSLNPGEFLYGIADLSLEELKENRFRAVYQEWSSLAADEDGNIDPAPLIRGRQITEEIFLERRRKAWVIFWFELIESRELGNP